MPGLERAHRKYQNGQVWAAWDERVSLYDSSVEFSENLEVLFKK